MKQFSNFLLILLLLSGISISARQRKPAPKTSTPQKEAVKPEDASKPADSEKSPEAKLEAKFAGLELRPIGPALISGRIVSIAVDPANRAHYYVGAASGGVWKTINDGATWTPVFEHEGSYSIGTVEHTSLPWPCTR